MDAKAAAQLSFKAPPAGPPHDGQGPDALAQEPPAKRAKVEEQDPALVQAIADGSVPALPKPPVVSGGVPKKWAKDGSGAPPPKGGKGVQGLAAKGAPPVVPPRVVPSGGKGLDGKGGQWSGSQVVPPMPKTVPAQSSGAGAWDAAMLAGAVSPKGPPQTVPPKNPGGVKCKSASAVPPPATAQPPAFSGAIQGMLSSRLAVVVPPPPHMAERQQHQEPRPWQDTWWQEDQWHQGPQGGGQHDAWQQAPQQDAWQQEPQQGEDQHQRWEEEQRRWIEEQKRLAEEEQARLLREAQEREAQLAKQAQEREEAMRQEQEAMALQCQGELAALLNVAEDKVEKCKAMRDSIDGKCGKTDEEVIKIADEFEVHCVSTRRSVKAVHDFMVGKYQLLKGVQESTRQEAVMFLERFKTAEKEVESCSTQVRARKREAIISRDKEIKRVKAQEAAEKQESLFLKYDADGDGVLSVREVTAFVKGECNFDLAQDKVEGILKSEAFAGANGVARAKFAQLRLLVGVASVVGALSGMEVEVAKAEEKAKPLAVRGRQAISLEVLEERTDEVDRAVDSARDYLAAAREQVQGLDLEPQPGPLAPTAVRLAAQEARKLGTKIEWFEQRLARAGSASKASRDRLLLQQKKAELMREADLAAMRAM